MDDIEKKLRSMINEQIDDSNKNIENLNDFHLIKDAGFDSIEIIKLIVGVEDEFGIEFDDDELDMDLICQFSKLLLTIKKQLQILKEKV